MITFELFLEMWNKSNFELKFKTRELRNKNKETIEKLKNPNHKVKKTDWYHNNKREKLIHSINQELKRRSSKFKNSNLSKK